jgi:hypothetical protein
MLKLYLKEKKRKKGKKRKKKKRKKKREDCTLGRHLQFGVDISWTTSL